MPEPGGEDEIIEAEIVPEPAPPDGYTVDGVPTLSYVRDKISTALGAGEIAEGARAGLPTTSAEHVRQRELRSAAAAKLASLREELARQPNPDQS